MARHLTPSKISLLALISVYSDSVVPAKATVPILSFLVSHVLPIDLELENSQPDLARTPTRVTLDVVQEVSSLYASGIPGRTIWDLLLNKLWNIDSLDALHLFFEHLSFLLQRQTRQNEGYEEDNEISHRVRFSRTSPLGIFVRRCQLEFARLQFQDGVMLWQSFVIFRSPTLQQWKKRNPSLTSTAFDGRDIVNDTLSAHPGSAFAATGENCQPSNSTEDIERLLEHQINQIQRLGTRLPEDMVSQLRCMLQANVPTPSLLYYIRFLEAWKMGDYPSSYDSLHQYFDYTMHNRDRVFYQYALLNLAALHADFGAFGEAMAAIQETISTAREHNDTACLIYSLSWLYHFSKVYPKEIGMLQAKGMMGTDKEALNFLKAKSKEVNMWCIFSTSLLGEARLALANGDSPSQAFESLVKASHVNLAKNLVNTVGTQMALTSTIYGRLGVNCQSVVLEQIFRHCYGARSPAEDQIQSLSRAAFLLAQRGCYSEALQLMGEVDQQSLKTLKYQRFWSIQTGILKFERCLHLNNLDAASQILDQLKAVKAANPDMLHSMTFLEIEHHIRQKDYSKALTTLEDLSASLNDGPLDVHMNIKTMICKARILQKAGIPQRGFSVALRAATLAHNAKILPALWEAVGALCAILHSLKEFKASIKLLENIMPQVLECNDCSLAARSFSLLADAHVGQAGRVQSYPIQCKEQLSKGLENLNSAFDEFSRMDEVSGQCEMLAKKAMIMHLNGDSVLANDCAAQYLSIKSAVKEKY